MRRSTDPAGESAATLLVGRVLLAALFLVFGLRSVLHYAGSVRYFASLGFPAPEAMVMLAIAIQLVGGILLVVGWKTRWCAWLLAAYVLIATLTAHRYWEYDAAQYLPQMTNFFKNLAIIGGLLSVAVLGPGRYSIDRG